MAATVPITNHIGRAERALRALLDPELREAGMTFTEWTTLVTLSRAPLTRDALLDRQQATHVDDGVDALAHLLDRGLIAAADGAVLALTDAGRATFDPLYARVAGTITQLQAGMTGDELETTARTLTALTDAAERLAADNA